MSSSNPTSYSQVPLVHHFELGEGIQLQVNVSGSSNGYYAKIDFQLKNCSRQFILHWGGIYQGQTKWILVTDCPPGTSTYKQSALQTPFVKTRDAYMITIQLRDPKLQAIEFVLKDERQDRWYKLKQRNFRIEIPELASVSYPSIPNELVQHKAYLMWERKGKPRNSPQQEKQDYEDALRELQSQLSRGMSLDELRTSLFGTNKIREIQIEGPTVISNQSSNQSSFVHHKRHDVSQWLTKHSESHSRGANPTSSSLLSVVEQSMGGDGVASRQTFHVGNNEIVVLLKTVRGDYHVLVATNMKGSIVLHWGVSKLSDSEWLAPPSEMLPERSKLLNGACQTYFQEMSTGGGFFQFVDINLQKRDFVGIQFILWSGSSWIKNNGSNFYINLKPTGSKYGKGAGDGNGTVKWLLDEIAEREKDAERSLMHR